VTTKRAVPQVFTPHGVSVLAELSATEWRRGPDVYERLDGIAMRTVRHHLDGLARLGLIEREQVFPAPMYRLAPRTSANAKLWARAHHVAELFGIPLQHAVPR
jgi:DNA-binding transcriptional ArsR family regulator